MRYASLHSSTHMNFLLRPVLKPGLCDRAPPNNTLVDEHNTLQHKTHHNTTVSIMPIQIHFILNQYESNQPDTKISFKYFGLFECTISKTFVKVAYHFVPHFYLRSWRPQRATNHWARLSQTPGARWRREATDHRCRYWVPCSDRVRWRSTPPNSCSVDRPAPATSCSGSIGRRSTTCC